jgi:2'-5' RNA ligase
VPSPAAWVESARRLVADLRGRSPQASWTRPESWHLTLLFLGEIEPSAVERLVAEGSALASSCPASELRADHATVFPPRGRARVLGIGFAAGAPLAAIGELARSLAAAARRVDLEVERREFHAHVTLARLRDCWPDRDVEDFRTAVAAWSFPPYPARELVLFESKLHPTGAVHTARGRWPLGGAAA